MVGHMAELLCEKGIKNRVVLTCYAHVYKRQFSW